MANDTENNVTEKSSTLSTVYKQSKLVIESDYEKRVRDAMARMAAQLRESGMDAIKAELMVLRLAVQHERTNGKR